LRADERDRLIRVLEKDESTAVGGASPPLETKRASIAVLFDDDDPFAPSTPETIEHLEGMAAENNVYVHRLGLDELERLAEYDALFIRALTGVREPSFQFALRAEMLDMPVLDDPQSIIRCSNKVFLEELLRREGIPTPRTMIVTPRTPWREVATLGTPVVVKLPDGSFSAAVHKISSESEYAETTTEMFRRSPLLIAQEFLRTEFDWRVTLLEGQVLFVARYFMAEGHWQIRSEDGQGERFGRVEAVPRESAPKKVVELARRAAGLIGKGLYGVDLKEGPAGPVVIEINDNPNLDRGEDDNADGDVIYRDVLSYFVRRIEARPADMEVTSGGKVTRRARRHFRPFSVAGMELEYAVVDEELEPVSLVEPAFRLIAGRPASDIDLGGMAFSNEIADHVFEIKIPQPTRSLAKAEDRLVQGIRRFSNVLRQEYGARLLPTGMHPWMDPREGKLWKRSGKRVYEAYSRNFDVHTHGWMNVHAAHLNLPMGRSSEAVAMHNATALLIPYLPALAASSPMYDGVLGESADNRMEWIFQHQAEVPETQGDILPEYVSSISDYRRRILQPMYRAIESRPGSEVLKHDFLNARGAVLKFSRRALEIRVVDMQECVKLDIAIAVFTKSVLRHYTQRILKGRMEMPPRQILLGDFRKAIRCGSAARVVAPHLSDTISRDGDGRAAVRDCLEVLLAIASRYVRRDEAHYLPLVSAMVRSGSLSERIRSAIAPHVGDPERLRQETRHVYGELADCLVHNEPWHGRDLGAV
jgi:glutathione synthase/RimK-type ligase-like ATP-grasp enzyme/gamma-glutamyl:cysteine ligase YbdK (ATP-grasp superfamily)